MYKKYNMNELYMYEWNMYDSLSPLYIYIYMYIYI